VFFGAWKVFPVVTGLALWGALLIGALYMLRAMRNVLHGPLPEKWSGIPDAAHVWRKLPYALLLASLLVFGCFPGLLTEKITPDAGKIVGMATAESRAGVLPAQAGFQPAKENLSQGRDGLEGRRDARPTLTAN